MTRALRGWVALALAVLALLSGGSRPLAWVALGLAAWCLAGAAAARLIGRGIRLADQRTPDAEEHRTWMETETIKKAGGWRSWIDHEDIRQSGRRPRKCR